MIETMTLIRKDHMTSRTCLEYVLREQWGTDGIYVPQRPIHKWIRTHMTILNFISRTPNEKNAWSGKIGKRVLMEDFLNQWPPSLFERPASPILFINGTPPMEKFRFFKPRVVSYGTLLGYRDFLDFKLEQDKLRNLEKKEL